MLRRRMNGSARSAFCASGHSISRDHGTLVYHHAHAGAASRPSCALKPLERSLAAVVINERQR